MKKTYPEGTEPSKAPHENDNSIHNAFSELRGFGCVDIHYEMDHKATDDYGDYTGTWSVTIQPATRGREVSAEDEEFWPALWSAMEQATKIDDAAYAQFDAAKKAALAKLTPEERKLLHI